MAKVNHETGPWLVGGEVLETEMFGRRKTCWPIKGQWACQTFRGRGRKWAVVYPFKQKEWQISTTSSRPRNPLFMSLRWSSTSIAPRGLAERILVSWSWMRCSLFDRRSATAGSSDSWRRMCPAFCQRSHHPYIFMPLSIFFPGVFLEISTLQDLTTILSRNVGNRIPSDATSCHRRTDTSHLHILFKTLQINDRKHEEDDLKLWRYIRQN